MKPLLIKLKDAVHLAVIHRQLCCTKNSNKYIHFSLELLPLATSVINWELFNILYLA